MSSGTTVHVSSGQISSSEQTVDTLIVDRGGMFFAYGPVASGVDNGLVVVEEDVRVSNITVGGALDVQRGTAQAITVASGGQLIDRGLNTSQIAAVEDVTVQFGGTLFAQADATASGVTVLPGGTVSVGAGGSINAVTLSGGRLELANSGGSAGTSAGLPAGTVSGVVFAGGGLLIDDGPQIPAGPISGFDTTDKIYLRAVPADPHATLTVSGDLVTVSAGGASYQLDIVGASTLALTLGIGTSDGSIDIGVACFCPGTAILTDAGERPVEGIAPGDRVITADRRSEEVVWVGRRSYAGRFLANNPSLLPVRVPAGALGGGSPRRDLLVSPNHALLLGSVLVPAGALVGCAGIAVEHGRDRVDYVHLELARHDVILAEGAATETFLDDGSRGIFQRSEGTPGHAATWCAPRVVDGYELELVRETLQSECGGAMTGIMTNLLPPKAKRRA